MAEERVPVYWREQLIGVMVKPTVDMFHLYGRWEPAEGFDPAAFEAALDEADVEVHLGGALDQTVWVMNPPDSMIEVRVRV